MNPDPKLYFLGGILFTGMLFVFSLLYISKNKEVVRQQEYKKTRILLGTITKTEPLHFYVESNVFGEIEEFDVIVSQVTDYLKLVPWKPGEKLTAEKDYETYLKELDPAPGDPIPPPPRQMKVIKLNPNKFEVGDIIGVRSSKHIVAGEPVIATVVRHLVESEIKRGNVSVTFPIF